MSTARIVQHADCYVMELIKERLPSTLYFHNPDHTRKVFDTATEIGGRSGLGKDETIILQLAALFHDTGYLFQYIGHEDSSIAIAGTYLIQQGYSRDMFEQVLACIEATKVPQSPKNLIQEIMCDADLYHFARPDYLIYADRLKKEWAVHLQNTYSEEEWLRLNLKVLTQHTYFTAYGKSVMQALKQQNIISMKNTEAGSNK